MATHSGTRKATEQRGEHPPKAGTGHENPAPTGGGRAVPWGSLTACLLHNDPASYCARRQVNPFRGGAVAKASLNRATQSGAVDAKRGELPMGRLKRP